jgi:hypothetical protein
MCSHDFDLPSVCTSQTDHIHQTCDLCSVWCVSQAMGNGTSGYEAAALWPKVCGIYQVPRNQVPIHM